MRSFLFWIGNWMIRKICESSHDLTSRVLLFSNDHHQHDRGEVHYHNSLHSLWQDDDENVDVKLDDEMTW